MLIAVASVGGDNFEEFTYYRMEGSTLKEQQHVKVAPGGADQFTGQLISLEIDLLIAGRIPSSLEAAIQDAGIPLISGVRGENDRVISQYLNGTLEF